ncbi:MAG: AlkZ family DNA glycosylase [Chloroflexi bacterium]|nr:AlkZ family DNA glycosylase [Chloroflexota bacterium]
MEKPAAEISLTWEQALAWRLGRHFLDEPTEEGAVAIARRLSGVHAQVMSSAELAIGIRTQGTSPADVQSAIGRERSLVKTWTVRGTLHLVAAEDLPMWVAALRGRTNYLSPAWLRYHGVTADEMQAIIEAIPQALDGRALTREALAREVARLSGQLQIEQCAKESWGMTLKPAAYQGLLCFGPNEGRNVTFVQPRQWVGDWREWSSAAAIAEILRRFLDAYGPANREDFGRWFGLEPRPTRELFERHAAELVPVDVEGYRAWLTRDGAQQLTTAAVADLVRLVPGFDPYVVASLRHAEHLMPGPFKHLISRQAGWISPVLLVNGRFAGTWRHEQKGGRLCVRVEPFGPVSQEVAAAAEQQAQAIGARVGLAVELAWAAPVSG